VWLAFEGEGMTAREVAAREGRPATTITWLILKARQDFAPLLARLEKEGAS
jgi:hypothetical protein